MHFTVLLFALLIDRLRPAGPVDAMLASLRRALVGLAAATDAGERHNPWLAALLVLVPVALLLVLARAPLGTMGLLLDAVVVLIVARIADVLQWAERMARAIDEGREEDAALGLRVAPIELASHPRGDAARARVTMEATLLAAHRRLFAPVFWYVLLPGCIGPALYLLVSQLREAWSAGSVAPAYSEAAQRLMRWADWLPARATAVAEAVVGNFEDAIYAWRQQAANWTVEEEGVVLASAAGALGVTLGDPRRVTPEFVDDGAAESLPAANIRSASALVWRGIVVLMVGLLLLGIGRMVG